MLESCLGKGLRWPERLVVKDAMRVKEYGDIAEQLAEATVVCWRELQHTKPTLDTKNWLGTH